MPFTSSRRGGGDNRFKIKKILRQRMAYLSVIVVVALLFFLYKSNKDTHIHYKELTDIDETAHVIFEANDENNRKYIEASHRDDDLNIDKSSHYDKKSRTKIIFEENEKYKVTKAKDDPTMLKEAENGNTTNITHTNNQIDPNKQINLNETDVSTSLQKHKSKSTQKEKNITLTTNSSGTTLLASRKSLFKTFNSIMSRNPATVFIDIGCADPTFTLQANVQGHKAIVIDTSNENLKTLEELLHSKFNRTKSNVKLIFDSAEKGIILLPNDTKPVAETNATAEVVQVKNTTRDQQLLKLAILADMEVAGLKHANVSVTMRVAVAELSKRAMSDQLLKVLLNENVCFVLLDFIPRNVHRKERSDFVTKMASLGLQPLPKGIGHSFIMFENHNTFCKSHVI